MSEKEMNPRLYGSLTGKGLAQSVEILKLDIAVQNIETVMQGTLEEKVDYLLKRQHDAVSWALSKILDGAKRPSEINVDFPFDEIVSHKEAFDLARKIRPIRKAAYTGKDTLAPKHISFIFSRIENFLADGGTRDLAHFLAYVFRDELWVTELNGIGTGVSFDNINGAIKLNSHEHILLFLNEAASLVMQRTLMHADQIGSEEAAAAEKFLKRSERLKDQVAADHVNQERLDLLLEIFRKDIDKLQTRTMDGGLSNDEPSPKR